VEKRPPFLTWQEITVSALVVYFSRSGHTQQLAKEIARQCGADLEEIRGMGSLKGFWGYWRSGWQVLTRAEPPIAPSSKDPALYDTVVIGTPIWIQHPAPAVRTWVRRHAAEFRQVAFFCTEGGNGDRQAFDELSRLCGRLPIATLTVTEKELPPELHADPLKHFTAKLTA
jgi:flavodoxin